MNAENSGSRLAGRVVEFDAHIGLGRIRVDEGEALLFHCAEIADGSRLIEVDSRVTFEVRRKYENPEAFAIQPE